MGEVQQFTSSLVLCWPACTCTEGVPLRVFPLFPPLALGAHDAWFALCSNAVCVLIAAHTVSGGRPCCLDRHPACAGHVWDVTYEDLVMDRVDNVINLGMFYFAPTPIRLNTSTMRYTDILFKNIRATRSGDKGHGGNAVAFNCDTKIKAGNCVVEIDGLSLTDMGAGVESQMSCQGAFGTVNDVVGLKNCLKAPPGGTCSSQGVKCGSSDPLAPKCCGNATCSTVPDCGGPPSPPPPSLCFLAPPPPPPGCEAIGGKCAALTDCCPDNWCHEIVCQSGTCTRQTPPTPPSPVSSEQQSVSQSAKTVK